MAKQFLVSLNLNQNEIQNVVIQNLASAPANPRAGQHYFDTTVHTEFVYDGEKWVDALSQGSYIFQNGIEQLTGVDASKVQLKIASGANAGNVTLSADSNGLKAEVAEASTSAKGIIEIATDAEAEAGTSETLAINPKQLATKVDANADITAGSGTVITYDAKGLVTGSSEIGINANSTNYLDFDTSTHTISANVDTTVTANSTNLVTSGAVSSAINAAIRGGVHYVGAWDITDATDFSGITLPAPKGSLYCVTGSGPKTIGGIEWNAGDYLLVNDDVDAGGSLVGKVDKIDNTESSDIVRLDATQTLTNKTIDASSNTISNLDTDNFASGIISTSIADASTASDDKLPSEKAVRDELDTKTGRYSAENSLLTTTGGIATWTVSHTLGLAHSVTVIDNNTGYVVEPDIAISNNQVVIQISSSSDIAAGTYKVFIVA